MNTSFVVNVNTELFDMAISKVSQLMMTIDPNSSVRELNDDDIADIQKGINEYKNGTAKLYSLDGAKKYLDEIIAKYQ